MDFGGRLRELRKKRGVKQEVIAKLLGVTRQAVSQYERGMREPNHEMLETLADYFNVTIDYLTGRDDNSVYYMNPETARIAQEIFENRDLRALFDVAFDAKPDSLRTAHDVLLALKKRERGDDY